MNNFKNRLHNFLPPVYASLAIGCSALFFIYMGQSGQQDVIGRFSIISTGIFLLTHIFSMGNDQSILSTKYPTSNFLGIVTDKRLLVPFVSFFLSFALISVTFELSLVNSYFEKYLIDYQEKQLFYSFTISITVFLANLSKTIASFLIINNRTNLANTLYLFKSVGLMAGILTFVFFLNEYEILIILLMELVCFVSLFLIIIIVAFKDGASFANQRIDFKYFLAGLNIFGFDSILKQDLIILSVFQSPADVSKYAVISSVFEGISQTITTLQQNYSKVLREKIRNKKVSLSKKLNSILFVSYRLSFLFFLAAPLFYFLVFSKIEQFIIYIIIFLQIGLLAGSSAIVTFYTKSILGNPIRLLSITIFIIFLNTFISVLLYNLIGILGVSIGTMTSFILLRKFIYSHARKLIDNK